MRLFFIWGLHDVHYIGTSEIDYLLVLDQVTRFAVRRLFGQRLHRQIKEELVRYECDHLDGSRFGHDGGYQHFIKCTQILDDRLFRFPSDNLPADGFDLLPEIHRLSGCDKDFKTLVADEENIELVTEGRILDEHHPLRDAPLPFPECFRTQRHELFPIRIRFFDALEYAQKLPLRGIDGELEVINLRLVSLRFRLGLLISKAPGDRHELVLQSLGSVEQGLDRFVPALHT